MSVCVPVRSFFADSPKVSSTATSTYRGYLPFSHLSFHVVRCSEGCCVMYYVRLHTYSIVLAKLKMLDRIKEGGAMMPYLLLLLHSETLGSLNMPFLASLPACRVFSIALFCSSAGFRFLTFPMHKKKETADQLRRCQLQPCHIPAPSGSTCHDYGWKAGRLGAVSFGGLIAILPGDGGAGERVPVAACRSMTMREGLQ
ncbi:hypothetical protein LZ32DRAFT_158965 [Colletotrichum eremochloae]|nr:hypothetical protein LZ32DRAFT_158965 [Colletotrichum eremochloae]